MGQDESRVIVTATDVYKELVSLSGDVRALSELVKQATGVQLDHEARLRSLERWRYALPVSTVMSASALIFGLWLHYH